MIYLYSGTPGSGKSLHAAQQIYEALHVKKRLVITNFPVNSYYSRFGKDKSIINKYSDLIVTNNQELHPEWLKFKSAEWFKLHHLHSTMFIFIYCIFTYPRDTIVHLHSTMFIFISC